MNRIALIACASLALTPLDARADEQPCSAPLGEVEVDDLRVPRDATCTLTGTRVKGNVKVAKGATLRASKVHVVGDIQADGAARVEVGPESIVGGNVQLEDGGEAQLDGVRIDGDLQLEQNRSSLAATGNIIGGNLQASENRGRLTIRDNRIHGDLQCKKNRRAPAGGDNVVEGDTEDQCAELGAGGP